MPIVQSRRHLLTNVAVAGATGFAGLGAAGLYGGRKSVAAEPPPEVTTIRFEKDLVTCIAPQVAEYLLRAEGFTDIRYVDAGSEWTGENDCARRSGFWQGICAVVYRGNGSRATDHRLGGPASRML